MDYAPINNLCPRQTHHTLSPWSLTSSVPEGVYKSVFNNRHGYHDLPLASKEDRNLTAFITPFGRYRCRTAPPGLKPSEDALTNRMDGLFQATERSRQCRDDTLIFDNTIKQQLDQICNVFDNANGLTLNPGSLP